MEEQKRTLQSDLESLSNQYEKIRILLEQKGYARKRRENVPTNDEMISNYSSSTRYRRKNETKNMLEFIHGGFEGSLYGAWDYLKSNASADLMETLFLKYKRGKFLEKLCGKFKQKDDAGMKNALAVKYLNFLSRRKYNFLCKIQQSTFDAESETFSKNTLTYGDFNLDIQTKSISHSAVDLFVKDLDIGELHQIPGYSGVTRTVTALVTMIVDLNLKVKSLSKNLIWFNNNVNHFVVEFSDDGAPESSERTMTVGTLSLWNYGVRTEAEISTIFCTQSQHLKKIKCVNCCGINTVMK